MTETTLTLETPPGQGGLALLVLEGPKASAYLHQCTRSNRLPIPSKDGQVRLMTLGIGQDVLDEVLIAQVKNSEDRSIFEIGIHGGPAVVEEVLGMFRQVGASVQRGKLSDALRPKSCSLEAEALSMLSLAQTAAASRVLLLALNGDLRQIIRQCQHQISQEEQDPAQTTLEGLISDYAWVRGLFKHPRIALLGPPNAGKSTLFNALIGDKRAITSNIAGTTRDYIEEIALLEGFPVMLIDTAGLRETTDHIEEQGIEYGLQSAQEADLRLYLRDPSETATSDFKTLEPCFTLINKADTIVEKPGMEGHSEDKDAIIVSAKTGQGLDLLRARLRRLLFPNSPMVPQKATIFCDRHFELVKQCLAAIKAKESARAQSFLSQLLEDFGKLSPNSNGQR
ncbi:MAG: 50S ribosome-binding GTPase [Planctomycetota bacterium]|nr:50S ribosome-binding GTPase [Planctomycetota bacterium]